MSMTGSFKLIRNENFDEYLNSVGVSLEMRQTWAAVTPTIDITTEGDVWTIRTCFTYQNLCRTSELQFKLGEEYDDVAANGRSCRSVISRQGDNKWLQEQKSHEGEVLATILTEFTDTEMVMTLNGPGNVVSTQVYQRQ